MDIVEVINNHLYPEFIENTLIKFGSIISSVNEHSITCTCPLHHGDSYNFNWYFENNFWRCHKESIGGDIINLYEEVYSVDFKTALQLVANDLGIDISNMQFNKRKQDYMLEINRWLKYMESKDKQDKFNLRKLGTAIKINRYRHLTKDTLDHFNVFYSKSYNRIVFPIDNIGASLRANGDVKPKWLHVPKGIKTGDILYNLSEVVSLGYREVFLVEGIIDVLSLYQIGVKNVVCTFGARITREQMNLLLQNFDSIILAFDNDEAGHNAILKSIDNYKYFINIKILEIEGFKDVGEITTFEEFNSLKIIKYNNY